ncbi:hypothetical protein FA95DRAFT_1563995 [Auriscalpium vulgare]|uniref:Uncharacterized protein n=1 Tax=Auriscalpium vulgare TaxID=40419 RepID=A0ACB8RGN5_9AGAM|nr:hypothetical protein FA95DRAFT_1563995 [Auriscalpium vulgare]
MYALLALAIVPTGVAAQAWCGKVYMANETVVAPGGQFAVPAASGSPLLALRCNPVLSPYLPDDLATPSSNAIIVDALVRYSNIAGAQPLFLPSSSHGPAPVLRVTVSLNGHPLTSGVVPLNGSVTLPFSLKNLTPRIKPFNLTCTGTFPQQMSSPSQTFHSTPASFVYLPSPPPFVGSITKIDLRSGALLAKSAHSAGAYEPIFPIGFYTNFGGYLEGNDTALEEIKAAGINIVHPIPTFDNLTSFNIMVDKMEDLGLWLMYDMRWTYMNSTAVTQEVTPLRNRSNLLLYYTGDEPDGSEDPLTAPATSAALLNILDPYRPVSLVLNCYDYFFTEYSTGTSILMQDTYPIGINATYSVRWNTPCTDIQGDCGCDDCVGDFEDIRVRMELFKERMEVLGWERGKAVWTVPQAFGGSEYWSRAPTGAEWIVENIVALNAGGLGSVSWNDPTPADIKAAASIFAHALPALTPFILSSPLSSPPVHYQHIVTANRLDLGVWSGGSGAVLVVAANLNYFDVAVKIGEALTGVAGVARQPKLIMDGGAKVIGGQFIFGPVQSGAWIFNAGA